MFEVQERRGKAKKLGMSTENPAAEGRAKC